MYEYHYQGFSLNQIPYYVNLTSAVEFQNNKVSFEIDVEDEDNDERAEYASISMSPSFHRNRPGHMFFVNPIWSTHSTGWNTAVNEARNFNTTSQLTESIGDGSFNLEVIIDIESESEDKGQLNGTQSYTFSASYDSDGILSNWELYSTTLLSNDNHTLNYSILQKYSRKNGPIGDGIIAPDIATTLGFVGVAGVAGLVIGILLAKRYYS